MTSASRSEEEPDEDGPDGNSLAELFLLCEDGRCTYCFRVYTGKGMLVAGNQNLSV